MTVRRLDPRHLDTGRCEQVGAVGPRERRRLGELAGLHGRDGDLGRRRIAHREPAALHRLEGILIGVGVIDGDDVGPGSRRQPAHVDREHVFHRVVGLQRVDPLHDGFDTEFNWQREYLVRRTDEQRRRYHPTRDTWGPLRVPMDKYFVLGDNRDNSADSRYWGFVDVSAVKGRPLVVYFSYDRGTRDALPWLTDIRWSRLGSLIR